MFDIGFSELVVIAVVALIVLGPERLPKAARTMGHLFGRLQRYVNDVKADINREIELEELRKAFASARLFYESSDVLGSSANYFQILEVMLQAGVTGLPAGKNVKPADPLVAGVMAQTLSASYFPNEPEMGAVWTPAGDMITKVIEGKSEPAAAAKEAADLINKANKK